MVTGNVAFLVGVVLKQREVGNPERGVFGLVDEFKTLTELDTQSGKSGVNNVGCSAWKKRISPGWQLVSSRSLAHSSSERIYNGDCHSPSSLTLIHARPLEP